MFDLSRVLDLEYMFWRLYKAFTESDGTIVAPPPQQVFPVWLQDAFHAYQLTATIIAVVLITGATYALIRLKQLRIEEHDFYYHEPEIAELAEIKTEVPITAAGAAKWQLVKKHAESDNSSDWRLAILEADIMLDDLLRSMGTTGESLGERLKYLTRQRFPTLDQAWEAHKVRNMIAHEGSDFILTEREVRRVIGLYEQVFRNTNYI